MINHRSSTILQSFFDVLQLALNLPEIQEQAEPHQ